MNRNGRARTGFQIFFSWRRVERGFSSGACGVRHTVKNLITEFCQLIR